MSQLDYHHDQVADGDGGGGGFFSFSASNGFDRVQQQQQHIAQQMMRRDKLRVQAEYPPPPPPPPSLDEEESATADGGFHHHRHLQQPQQQVCETTRMLFEMFNFSPTGGPPVVPTSVHLLDHHHDHDNQTDFHHQIIPSTINADSAAGQLFLSNPPPGSIPSPPQHPITRFSWVPDSEIGGMVEASQGRLHH
ncbi:unnamed protein product [Linum trigynum]|uniref:Uncharacterized protein n=1 Tax=Linum trigynum TaxID=586398 RepID=A0AAV2FEU0_9ROSI